MSLKSSDLSVLAYANSFTFWHYRTTDASVTTAGYMDDASDMLRVNDMIVVNLDTDGLPSTGFFIVTGNSNGSVTLSALA